jgi:hypothetical protein
MNVHTSEQAKTPVSRVVDIELLALDLTTCTRCLGTLENIEKAINVVRPVLEATGAQVKVTRLVIESDEQARQYRFVASPTVGSTVKTLSSRPFKASATPVRTYAGATKGLRSAT